MNTTHVNRSSLGLVLGAILPLLLAAAPGVCEPLKYVQDDCRISAESIGTFTDNAFHSAGEQVTVLQGRVVITVGKRRVSCDRAVLWIASPDVKKAEKPEMARHDLTIYAEGNVEVQDEANSVTRDKLMLIHLHVQGRLKMAGHISAQPAMRQSPLFKRAMHLRKDGKRVVSNWRTKAANAKVAKSPTDKPLVVLTPAKANPLPSRAGKAETALETPAKTKTPTTVPEGSEPKRVTPIGPAPAPLESLGEPKPAPSPVKITAKGGGDLEPAKLSDVPAAPTASETPPPALQAVHITAPGGVTVEKDKANPKLRYGIAKNNILLTVGTADSDDEYAEMQADYAVIFAREGVPDRDTSYEKIPHAPPLMGVAGFGDDAKITGVYLQGHVTMTAGEKSIKADALYYDFQHDKAVILKPVMQTIQEQRNIPVIIRGERAEVLSQRETKFYDALVSTSDMHTPSYALAAKEVTFRDETPYDSEGNKLGERAGSASFRHATWDIRGVPVMYLPYGNMNFEEGHSPLRSLSVGQMPNMGFGVESQWHLFSLLGLAKPEGLSAKLNAEGYEKGYILGIEGDYEKQDGPRDYSGYFILEGVYDKASDDFGNDRNHIQAPENRGRVLLRHKEFLPGDWELQGELSLLSDANFMEAFYPDEFWAGKEQENLIYAKKQRDNWAVTALLKGKLNRFLTQTESYPEVAGYLIGQPLMGDMLTYFGEARLGAMRYNEDSQLNTQVKSDVMARFDMRHELNMPLELQTAAGPLNIVPYVVGRLTTWSDMPTAEQRLRMYDPENYPANAAGYTASSLKAKEEHARFYGQAGVRMNMSFWRIYNNVQSRLLDINRLKHIIRPEFDMFVAGTNVQPDALFPLSPGVEQHLWRNVAGVIGLHQLLQTKRGPAGKERTVDWMRLDLKLAYFHDNDPFQSGDGRYFYSRPEYGVQNSFFSAEYLWNISDAVAFMADTTFSLDRGVCERVNAGFNVNQSPRLNFYTGLRYLKDVDSMVATAEVNYKINEKFRIRATEQYDFKYHDGMNLGSRFSLIRKFQRWNAAVTFTYDARYKDEDDEYGVMLTLWPEGVPEARIGTGKFALNNQSSKN